MYQTFIPYLSEQVKLLDFESSYHFHWGFKIRSKIFIQIDYYVDPVVFPKYF